MTSGDMTSEMTPYASPYQIGGSLQLDAPTYVVRRADSELYEGLKAGEFCYVLTSRQMGKSSLMVRTSHQLQQDGDRCAILDLSGIGSDNLSPDQWYKSIAALLWDRFELGSLTAFRESWKALASFSSPQRLGRFIDALLLTHFPNDNLVIFLDEIDKLCARQEARGGDVSREGVQRDLLPLIEGTTVSTKYGAVKTDHILFIASGAFHIAKPSDLLPELQGRLPIRVELRPLTEEDFVRILTETDNALTRQYSALMGTEEVEVSFTDDGIAALARIAAEVNHSVENIGARRLYTVMERVFEELSFTAPDRSGDQVVVDAAFVDENVGELAKSAD